MSIVLPCSRHAIHCVHNRSTWLSGSGAGCCQVVVVVVKWWLSSGGGGCVCVYFLIVDY